MAKLGEMLMKEGLLTKEQLDKAMRQQKQEGAPLGGILVRQGVLTENQLVDVLARQTGFPKFDLDARQVDPALAKVMPLSLAQKYNAAPLMMNGNVLSVGLVDPENERSSDGLAQLTGKTIKVMVVGENRLKEIWKRLYGDAASGEKDSGKIGAKPKDPNARYDLSEKEAAEALEHASNLVPDDHIKVEEDLAELVISKSDSPVIQLVNAILMEGLESRASDIHLEPGQEKVKVRYRVDGKLRTTHELPLKVQNGMVSRLKVLAQLDIAEKRFPQDGRVKLARPGKNDIDFRMSTLPGIYGEKVVLRVLGTGQLMDHIDKLGFRGHSHQYVADALRNHFGMILVTGPTGSGKTTTLYTMLSQLCTPDVNIVTAEDPVEYNLAGITQVSVKPQIGFTFDVALRSFLRQDPDIILVGEMRDYETAAIAVKAALTGHVVFSTLHTNDAPSTVVRMVDMGIEPYLVSSAVKLVVAQRLIRRLCKDCKTEVDIAPEEQDNLHESTLAGIEQTFKGAGCETCAQTGYRGRTPVFEVMPVRSKELKRVITEGGTEVMVAQCARREGLRTLKDEAMELVNEGVTSLEEALQIIVSD